MEEFYLPVLSHFENGNVWTASGGKLHYKLTPGGEVIAAQVWEGPWSYEDSPIEAAQDFPLSEEGLVTLRHWLAEWTDGMGARPNKTMAEALAARDQYRAALAAAKTAEA